MAKAMVETRTTQARRGLLIFFALLIPFSALFEWLLVTRGLVWVAPLMWTPAAASIVARLALGEGFGDVSFRLGRGSGKALLYAWLFPVGAGLIAYGIAWLIRLTQFAPPTHLFGYTFTPLTGFIVSLAVFLTVGTAQSAPTAAGEEIGWRGYMLTRLIDARVPAPLLVSGLIWAAWHLPLILAGVYLPGTSLLVTVPLFVVGATALAYVLAILRLDTGSIWPAVLLHASWNALIQGPFDHATTGAAAPLWTGEAGILTVTVVVIAAFLLARRPWTMHREPVPSNELS
jgi:membrane protease YdiL (CAAX protease family)